MDGILFLGKSETVGQFADLFTTLDGKYALRMVTSQTNVSMKHIHNAWNMIKDYALRIDQ